MHYPSRQHVERSFGVGRLHHKRLITSPPRAVNAHSNYFGLVGGLVDETVVDVTVVGVARTVVTDATVVGVARTVVTDATVVAVARATVVGGAIVAVARATVVDGAIVAVVARMVVAVSFDGAFVPGVVEAGVEEIDEGVVFPATVDPVDIDGAVPGPVGAFSTIAA